MELFKAQKGTFICIMSLAAVHIFSWLSVNSSL